MVMMARGVRARLGLERRATALATRRAKSPQHAGEHLVRGEAQRAVAHLDRRVPVAEMEGAARKRGRVGTARLHQRFVRGDHAHDAAVVRAQAIAAAQHRAAVEHEADLFAAREPA
jgi:hypothetical protein